MSGSTIKGRGGISGSSVGGLVGYYSAGTITGNCYVTGSTIEGTAENNYVGGLVGYSASTISGCYVSGGTVKGGGNNSYAGGLVGDTFTQSGITSCYVSGGIVIESVNAGGLVGRYRSATEITSCYVSGITVTGSQYAGGLVAEHTGGGTITTCYVSGATITGATAGGLVAEYGVGSITTCYVLGGTITGRVAAGGLLGNTTFCTSSACYVSGVNVAAGQVVGNNAQHIGSLAGSGLVIMNACYARGRNYTNLIGKSLGAPVNYSYYQAASSSDDTDATVQAKTKAALIAPTDFTGIFVRWNDLDADGSADATTVWDFGTNADLPNLKADFNGDGTPTVAEFSNQMPPVRLTGNGIYEIASDAAAAASVDMSAALSFGAGITHWWVTRPDGSAASSITGVTGVSHDGSTEAKRQAVATKSFTIHVEENPDVTSRDFTLRLQVGKATSAATDYVDFSVKQLGVLLLLTDNSYDISAGPNNAASVNFGNALNFGADVVEWWVTQRDGTPASGLEGITSVSRNNSNRGGRTDKDFTINVEANSGMSPRPFELTIHVATTADGSSAGSVDFTVTQALQPAVLSTTTYTIAASTDASAVVDFDTELMFRPGSTHWWVTQRDGTAASGLSGITSVSHDGSEESKRQAVATKSFTINVEGNPDVTSRDFELRLQAGTATGAATGFVDFTVTQAGRVPDGLIPINNLEQLHAMRYDLNSDGQVDHVGDQTSGADDAANLALAQAAYAAAFPDVVYAANRYTGYKLARSLNFRNDASYSNATANKVAYGGDGTGTGWLPVGRYSDDINDPTDIDEVSEFAFRGTFDGGGHTIDSLYIDKTTGPVGLFGFVSGSTIKNVGIVDASVTGGDGAYVGGLVSGNGGTISACYVSESTIETGGGDNSQVGGLVAHNILFGQIAGTISDCYVSGSTIKGGGGDNSYIGGLVGQNNNIMRDCYVTGSTIEGRVEGRENAYVGGLVGLHGGTISGCYVSGGKVKGGGGNAYAGGLMGQVLYGNAITACYVSGGTVIESVNAGGLVGKCESLSPITSCYVSGITVTGTLYAGGLVAEQVIGTLTNCYVSGLTIAGAIVGGLVGQGDVIITGCYVSGGTVTGSTMAGGLLGSVSSSGVHLSACYVSGLNVAAGQVVGNNEQHIGSLVGLGFNITMNACYARGRDYTNLIGTQFSSTVNYSYYQAASEPTVGDDARPGVQAKTRAALLAPTGFTGIFAKWNDLDADGSADASTVWDFGTASQFPVLNVDFNGDDSKADDVERQQLDGTRPFITKWETTADGETITIPTASGSTYNYAVDWGDGTTASNVTGDTTHTYASKGVQTITISGDFPRIQLGSIDEYGDVEATSAGGQIRTVEQWGDIAWTSMEGAFGGCDSLTINATDAPDLSGVTSVKSMFSGYYDDEYNLITTFLAGDLSGWDVSGVMDMSGIFLGSTFTGDLNKWNVSSVTDMQGMFGGSSFNGNISDWDVSSVTNMSGMFEEAPFNQDVSDWNVSSVTDMSYMFSGSVDDDGNPLEKHSFNRDLSKWNVSSVTDMLGMFYSSFFNGNISKWNVSGATDMRVMFAGSSFSGDISAWDVSSVTDMSDMFSGASFNGDLSGWDIGEVTDMEDMFEDNSSMSAGNYDKLLIGWSTLDTEAGETQIPPDITFGAPDHYSCAGVAARAVLTDTYSWTITGDDLVSDDLASITADIAVLPPLTVCRITAAADLTAPTANSQCDGNGTTITGVHNIPDDVFPITSDTTITWTYTHAGKSIVQTQQVTISSDVITPNMASLPLLPAVGELTSLTAPTATNCAGETLTATHGLTLPITSDRTITWTYSDAGNTLTQTQEVAITGPIPVSTLEQLNAIRYDLNGDGKVDHRGDKANLTAAGVAYAEVFQGVEYDSENPNKYTGYALTKNLDFNENASYSDTTSNKSKWTMGTGWLPIWYAHSYSDGASFSGTFDGKGYTISNLYIKRSKTFPTGLFGVLSGTIKDIGLVDASVTSTGSGFNDPYVGALVGYQRGGSIASCYVSGGTIKADDDDDAYVGGLVGWQFEGTITSSYVSGGSVTGGDEAGGLVGQQDGTITSSYVSGGSVTGGSDAGGLVGQQDGTITSSYVSGGSVTGGSNAGGLVGAQRDLINTCYVLGVDVKGGDYSDVGGLVGEQAGTEASIITSSYVDGGSVTGGSHAGGLVGRASNMISSCYASGVTVTSTYSSGGLVGSQRDATISACYVSNSTIKAGNNDNVGGLVGEQNTFSGSPTISACYVSKSTLTGRDNADIGSLVGYQDNSSTITACYAGGMNYTNLRGREFGMVTNSYYQAASSSGNGKTQSELQTPIAYGTDAAIYANWNLNINGVDGADDPWDFGTSSQYPVLNIDFNGDGSKADDIARQRYGSDYNRLFITTWETTTASETITIPTASGLTYNYTVDWGDGTTDSNVTGNASHTYSAKGIHTVTISGDFPYIQLGSLDGDGQVTTTPAAGQIRTVEQWGDMEWVSMRLAFANCDSLTINAGDTPDLSRVRDMLGIFFSSNLSGDLSDWNVSSFTNMQAVFYSSSFNGDISDWNVGSVTDMRLMFYRSSFNSDISEWDVSSVTDMEGMFQGTFDDDGNLVTRQPFNQDISGWNVRSVTNMSGTFRGSSFNQDLSKWNVSSVTNMGIMFAQCPFNQDISGWNVRSVTNMSGTFRGSSFNQDLSKWNVSSVTNMGIMFAQSPFNQDISKWNVSSVTDMSGMFNGDLDDENNLVLQPFSGDLSGWDVSSVTNMVAMFAISSFNGDISGWDISSVTNMTNMFNANSSMSSENYDALLVGWSTLAEGESQIPSNITFEAPNFYSCAGVAGRDKLINDYSWTITGDKLIPLNVNDLPSLRELIEACEVNSLTAPTITNCSGETITATQRITLPITSDTTIRWTFTDAGTRFIQTQQVTITDNTAPDPDKDDLSGTTSVGSLAEGDVTIPTATDNCGGEIMAVPNVTFPLTADTTITWTYTDAAGNTATQTQEVTITEEGSRPFITKWETTTNSEIITIPTASGSTYNYTVDWGDDTTDSNITGDASHTYATKGVQTITISGDFPQVQLGSVSYSGSVTPKTAGGQIRTVEQWGDIAWSSMEGAFAGCDSLTINATDAPNLSSVTDMSFMFSEADFVKGDLSSWNVSSATNMWGTFANAGFTGDISSWNVSSVTDMDAMFEESSFNGDISDWNVSSVTTMWKMFKESSFNSDIGDWDVSNVTDMSEMFLGGFSKKTPFNRDISDWDVSSVTTMSNMFAQSSFNKDINDWDVSSVKRMYQMFYQSSFNRDLNDWNVSSVTNMNRMFAGFSETSPFSGDISEWNVSSVTIMHGMFSYSSFTGDISGWNVSSVTDMSSMFEGSAFNGDISEWDVSSVTDMSSMFEGPFGGKSPFTGDISGWNVSRVTDMSGMFNDAIFNGDISGWNVSRVTDMGNMFDDAAFDGDISEWDVSSVTSMRAMFSGSFGEKSPFNGDISQWDVSSVTDMSSMFSYADFNGDISEWDVSSVTGMSNMFVENTSMSSENYDKLLIGWSTLDTEAGETQIPTGITFGAPDYYSCVGVSGRDKLINDYSWTITGDGLVPIKPDVAALSAVRVSCEVTKTDLTAPMANSKCDGSGITVTATHNMADAAFPITSDTTITWTYTHAGESITQTQEVVVNDAAITPDVSPLRALTPQGSLASLTAPTATNCAGETLTATQSIALPITSDTTITWTYDDGNGNTATQTQEVMIIEQTVTAVPSGLIPISNLEQLNSIRYDLNGDGKVDHKGDQANLTAAGVSYAAVFSGVEYDSENPDKYTGYALTKNLDFNENASYSDTTGNKSAWTTGAGWEPVGPSSGNPFSGTFGGGGYKISNLYINRTGSRLKLGLFGYVTGTISDTGIEDSKVTGGAYAYVGGLVGRQRGTVSGCYVSGGTIEGGGLAHVGGLVGYQDGTVSGCYVSGGTIEGGVGAWVGGLVGWQQNGGTVSGCYVSGGTIEGGSHAYVGGLVGRQQSGTVSGCYVSGGTIEGGDGAYVGGLVGRQSDTVSGCYVHNSVSSVSSGSNVGSLIGGGQGGTVTACYAGGRDYTNLVGSSSGTITNSYYQAAVSSGNGKMQIELQTPIAYGTGASIYANWNLNIDGVDGADDPWNFGTSSQYPVLNIDFNGNGSKTDDIARQRQQQQPEGSRPFITKWETTANGETITIPTASGSTYNYTVDWGDGTIASHVTGDTTHTYARKGVQTITISGDFPRIQLGSIDEDDIVEATSSGGQIRTVEQWGDIAWTSMEGAFASCDSLTINATDAPNLSGVTSMKAMFVGHYVEKYNLVTTFFTGDLSKWNVSSITDMSDLFSSSTFNGDISKWDVSSVTDMSRMFESSRFNGDLSGWDVSHVTDMEYMFIGSSFNRDISSWNVSSVTDMWGMFSGTLFTGDISSWDVGNVTDMSEMFGGRIDDDGNLITRHPFNGDLSNWNVSSVTDMSVMFAGASFTGDISDWNVSSVTDMYGMFAYSSFTNDISDWDVSSVMDMSSMFYGSAFNNDVSGWDVSEVTDMPAMFYRSSFNGDLSDWNVSSVTDMSYMFFGSSFNGDLNGWNVSNVEDMSSMFQGRFDSSSGDLIEASAFNQDISGWDISGIIESELSYSMTDMFVGSSMSSENYDKLLIGWSTLDTEAGETQIPTGLTFGAPDQYSCAGVAGREALTGTYSWTITGDELIPIKPAVVTLPTVMAGCEVTKTDLTAPMANSKCDGSGTTVTATHNMADAAFPITSDTTITWTYTHAGESITQTQAVTIDAGAITPDIPSLTEVITDCRVTSLEAPTATNCAGAILTATQGINLPITSNTTITWTYDDGNGNTATQTQSVTIDAGAITPDIPSLTKLTADCKFSSLEAPTATNCAGATLTATQGIILPITSDTTITWTYDDGNGNTATQTQAVVVDAGAITPDVPSLKAVITDCQVTSLEAPTATNCAGATFTATQSVMLPITSDTTITWTYDDGNGNTATQTQQVITGDNTAPDPDEDDLPPLTAACSLKADEVTIPTASDNCDGPIMATTDVAPPFTKSMTITWTYADAVGNTTTQTQEVTIDDNMPPTPDPDNDLLEITRQCSLRKDELKTPAATDNCSGEVTVTNNVASFPIEESTLITWTYTDAAGNRTTQTQQVTIDDMTAPVPVTADLPTLEDCSQIISLTIPTATDNCSGSVTVSGDVVLPITESTLITWTYRDAAGNASEQTQQVIIGDNEAPKPEILSLEAITGQCSLSKMELDAMAPAATDNCSESVAVKSDVIAFPITASTMITWTYTDGAGNTATQQQEVIIDDNTAPVPDNDLSAIKKQCSLSKAELDAMDAPTATDECEGYTRGTYNFSAFPITSDTAIVWTYDDGEGNMSTQMQQVIIKDTIAPVLDNVALSEIILESSLASDDVTVPTATDNCDGQITANTDAIFPITSTTTITWAYTDAAGNKAEQTQRVTITTAPLSASDDVVETMIFPNPAGRYVEVRSPKRGTFRILSLSGKLLLEGSTNTDTDISSLQIGIYMVQLPDGRLLKFIKE